jgi:hypothetical protein
MSTIKSAVAMGLVAASSAFAVQGSPRGLAFAGLAMPRVAAQGHALASQRQPALRQAKASSLKVGAQGARGAAALREPPGKAHAADHATHCMGMGFCVC